MTTTAVNPSGCRWCGMIHGPQCPTVKAIEFFADGTVKRVEFKTANDYPPIGGVFTGKSGWTWDVPPRPVATCGGGSIGDPGH